MKFDVKFDEKGLQKKILELAAKKVKELAEATRREMGAMGAGIQIKDPKPYTSGNETSLGGVSFPSEEVKEEFMKRFNKKFK